MAKLWFPLESNPEVLKQFINDIGVDVSCCDFVDVLSTELWALEMIPTPVLALLVLYPITKANEQYRLEEAENIMINVDSNFVSTNVFFMKQTVDNACGTIGLLHAVINNRNNLPSFGHDSLIEKFYSRAKELTPEERALLLENDETIEAIHGNVAEQGQSEQIDIHKVNSHFICITNIDGHLYELDGRKIAPICHGQTTEASFLVDGCNVVRKFMNRDPDEVGFTIVALVGTKLDE